MSRNGIKGCVHLHINKGKIANVFSHLSKMPKNCVVHLKVSEVLTKSEFQNDHSQDKEELSAKPEGRIYNLGNSTFKR
jgi:hypothetical protein